MSYCPRCGQQCSDMHRFCAKCGSTLSPTVPQPPSAGNWNSGSFNEPRTELGLIPGITLLYRYRILAEIGAGGMGIVYRAEDEKLKEIRAIKTIRQILSRDEGSVARLMDEARLAMRLSHPNIVRVYNFEDDIITKFLVMEFVEGESLAGRLARERRLSEEETRRIGIEICKGLAHAHENKVIHRDLKPGNILLSKSGAVKIADFGIARVARDSVSRLTAKSDPGTLLYMSPQQLIGKSSESSDQYSLGVVLYETLSGRPPFESGDVTYQIREIMPDPVPGISSRLNGIVLKCLAKMPEQRFASVTALQAELAGVSQGQREEPRPPSRGREPGPAYPAAAGGMPPVQPAGAPEQIAAPPGRAGGIDSFAGLSLDNIDFKGAAPGFDRRSRVIRSVDIIARMASNCGASPQEAAAVVDGFWTYVTDPANFARDRTLLVIPHFGYFRCREKAYFRFTFRSQPVSQLIPKFKPQSSAREHQAGLLWISRFSAGGKNPQSLSVKRRMTWYISQTTRLPAARVDSLMRALFQILVTIFTIDKLAVNWARRGTMFPVKMFQGRDPATGSIIKRPAGRYYGFRASPSFLNRIKDTFQQ